MTALHITDEHTISEGASGRIRAFFVACAAGGAVLSFALWSWVVTLGFFIGAALAFVALLQLELAVARLGERSVGNATESAMRTVIRFLSRYVVILLAGYVIFRSSLFAFYGFVGALFMPVVAMVCEASYEMWAALTRKL